MTTFNVPSREEVSPSSQTAFDTLKKARGDVKLDALIALTKDIDAIETHYREKHSAGEYARLLNISTKALAKITKRHFNKTLTDMIAERIVIEDGGSGTGGPFFCRAGLFYSQQIHFFDHRRFR